MVLESQGSSSPLKGGLADPLRTPSYRDGRRSENFTKGFTGLKLKRRFFLSLLTLLFAVSVFCPPDLDSHILYHHSHPLKEVHCPLLASRS